MQLGQAYLVSHDLRCEPELLHQFHSGRVTLGVDPRAIQRILAVEELEEARGLRERRRADFLDLRQLHRAWYGPCSVRNSTIRRAVNWLRPET